MKTKQKGRPTALGAWIFAGGFTLGMQTKFEVLAHLEESDYGVATVKKNFPRLPVHIGNVDTWPVDDFKGVDLVYGNPPCAAWSQAGHMTYRGTGGWRDDDRINCTRRHFSLIERLRPKAWVWESVMGAFTNGRSFVHELTEQAHRLGYAATYVLHDARHLGVCQKRRRFFCVFHRIAIPWNTDTLLEQVPSAQVLSEEPPPGDPMIRGNPNKPGGEAHTILRLIPQVRPGEPVTAAWERDQIKRFGRLPKQIPLGDFARPGQMKMPGRMSFGNYRLKADEPANAVVGYTLIHPTVHRVLTDRECARLMSFPDNYEFVGRNPNEKIKLMARGVCPVVGAWLAGHLARAIKEDQPLPRKNLTYIFDARKPPAIVHELSADVPLTDVPTTRMKTKDDRKEEQGDLFDPRSPRPRAATIAEFRSTAVVKSGGRGRKETTRFVQTTGDPDPVKARGRRFAPLPQRPTPRAPRITVDYDALMANILVKRLLTDRELRPAAAESSGAWLRRVLIANSRGVPDEILAATVRKHWGPGRTTSVSDVAYQRNELKKLGTIAAPRVPFAGDPR